MNLKIKAYVGFAIRKGSVIFGFDNIKKRPAGISLVMICSSVSQKTFKEAEFFCRKNKIALIQSGVPLGELASRQGVKVIGLTDKNLSQAVLRSTDKDFKCVEVVN